MKRWSLFLIVVMLLSAVPGTMLSSVSADVPYVSIHDIQYTEDPSGDSPYKYSTVITRGVVTAIAGSKGFFIQNGTGAWNGIYVYLADYSMPEGLSVGSYVEVKGYVKEYYGLTELSIDKDYGNYVTILGTADVPAPVILPSGNVSQEQWESVLVKVENVEVTDPDLGYGEWKVDDGSGPLVVDDLMYHYSPTMGERFESITGVVYYSYGKFKLEPRDENDLKIYVPLIKVASLDVPSAANRNDRVTIKATLANEGTFDENVTFLIYIDDELKLNQTVELKANSSEEVTYDWIPMELGSHVVKAEIEGYDTKYASIHIFENPSTIINTYSRYYTIRYLKEKETFDELYATYENLTSEVEACGVSLDILSDYMELISENKAKYDEYSAQFQELQGIAYTQSYLATKYFITARGLAITQEKLIGELNTVIPILQDALEKCQAGEEVVIEKPEGVKVLVDNGHGQYYNSGKMITLITKMKEELNWTVELNEDEFTADELKDYDIVIITNPHEDFTDEEIAALHEYVENGGGLLVTGDWYRYVYHRTLNDLVSAFGITFNDDELMDEEVNSGAAYFPFVGEFNEHPTTKFLTSESQLYYNGDTLDITGDAVWLVRGYESSYAVDEDGNVVKEKGSKPIVAAAAEFGNGRVVVYGSSKALSDDYNGNYINSNWPFLKGVLLWLAGQI
ncbi:DUF4350 domain-containing protein [Palaeococcus ferrophilus]|uniref:DUF4350 domain-containing protein n=1 Tax=Palaeococcus ferrophilus TaxID=83868 RepID=UPI00064EB811|nr:DUF4350 domain-containing protein [Palaeococcus ferrophilus]